MQLENTDGYLLYKNVEGVINGIWFFERKNKDNFYEFLKGIISKLSINGTEDSELEPMTEQINLSTSMSDLLNSTFSQSESKLPTKKPSSDSPSSYYSPKVPPSRLKTSPLLYMPSDPTSSALEGSATVNHTSNRPLLPFLTSPESLAVPQPIKPQVSVLSRQQFKASLLQLVNNDSFIESAYSEYLKSFSTNSE
jgi:hypothetical protein